MFPRFGVNLRNDFLSVCFVLVAMLLIGAMLSGCDVNVEAANERTVNSTKDRSAGEGTGHDPSHDLAAENDTIGAAIMNDADRRESALSDSISYNRLLTSGILFALENQLPAEPVRVLGPNDWMDLPVIPEVSNTSRRIYEQGLKMGNNPHAFSKVGDCQNVYTLFLGPFDDPGEYELRDEDAHLQDTIDWFAGSFSRESQAVRGGFNAATVLSTFWADQEHCERDENPLQCEFRIHKPSFAIINLETWWEKSAESYEPYLRTIIETSIAHGIVPILSTKADNLEGDHSINTTIARLAVEYDVPLWNFWRAVQSLPEHGLQDDGFHLTYARNFFNDPIRMEAAWPWRNLTALQTLDAVWRGVSSSTP